MEPKWLEWARHLQALAQAGLTYTENPFDRERYIEIRKIAAEIMATYTEADLTKIDALFKEEHGYQTPKVAVRGVVFKDDQILLVRELADQGRWTLPGGWADINESPGEAVIRETYEESGYRTRAVKLLALYDCSRHGHPPMAFYTYKLFFLCEWVGGTPTKSIETADAAFFPEHAIPELSIARVTPAQITRCFEHHRHPDWPTDFD
jgi:ADP-ribose pyrophosphatase YjhB (NUDIX family)